MAKKVRWIREKYHVDPWYKGQKIVKARDTGGTEWLYKFEAIFQDGNDNVRYVTLIEKKLGGSSGGVLTRRWIIHRDSEPLLWGRVTELDLWHEVIERMAQETRVEQCSEGRD